MNAQVGECAREAGISRLFTLGMLSKQATVTFGDGARHFERIDELLAAIEELLAPQVTMLVKGSRFMQMERVIKAFEIAADADTALPTGVHQCC